MIEKIGKAIEDYANKSIPRSKDEFGQFMYHAELIKRGHSDVSKSDMKTLPAKYQKVITDIISKCKSKYDKKG